MFLERRSRNSIKERIRFVSKISKFDVPRIWNLAVRSKKQAGEETGARITFKLYENDSNAGIIGHLIGHGKLRVNLGGNVTREENARGKTV